MFPKNNLGQLLKQQRVMLPMTLQELAVRSDVSASHLGRIETGQRFPSARILHKLAEPLGFVEGELFVFAGYLPPTQPSKETNSSKRKQLDPYVAKVLSEEPLETQRTVLAIL